MGIEETVNVLVRKDVLGYAVYDKADGSWHKLRFSHAEALKAYNYVEGIKKDHNTTVYYAGFRNPLELELLMHGKRYWS